MFSAAMPDVFPAAMPAVLEAMPDVLPTAMPDVFAAMPHVFCVAFRNGVSHVSHAHHARPAWSVWSFTSAWAQAWTFIGVQSSRTVPLGARGTIVVASGVGVLDGLRMVPVGRLMNVTIGHLHEALRFPGDALVVCRLLLGRYRRQR